MKKFIVLHNIGKDITWYVAEVRYNDETYPANDWVLGTTDSQERKRALKFTNRHKAEEVAKILSSQVDEMGGSFDYYVKGL